MKDVSNYLPDPYKGLIPYSETDRLFFFGRENEKEDILEKLIPPSSRLTILYGASGVGKSSVLRAGVAHYIHQAALANAAINDKPGWAVIVFPPIEGDLEDKLLKQCSWQEPLTGIKKQLEETIKKLKVKSLNSDVPCQSFAETLNKYIENIRDRQGESRLFIILDQFEEYFSNLAQKRNEDIDRFAEEISLAVKDSSLNANFLIAIREESLAELDCFDKYIPNLFKNRLKIDNLDEQSARAAIEQPLAEYNRQFVVLESFLKSRLTVLYGKSDVHKSTLLNLGIANYLRYEAEANLKQDGNPELAVVVFSNWYKDRDILTALKQQIKTDIENLGVVESPQPDLPLLDTLREWTKLIGGRTNKEGKLFIILDHFEKYLDHFEKHFLLNSEQEGENNLLKILLDAINDQSLNVHFLVAMNEERNTDLCRFQEGIPCDYYLHLFKDGEIGRIAKVKPEDMGKPYSQQSFLNEFSIDQELCDKVLEGLKKQNTKPLESLIETFLLQLVMKHLWTKERKCLSKTLRTKTFLDLGQGDSGESVKRIVRDYLYERLGDPRGKGQITSAESGKQEESECLTPTQQDLAACIFHFLVTPRGYKLPQHVSDLSASVNEYRAWQRDSGYSLLQKRQFTDDDIRHLADKLEKSRILRRIGDDRYEIFHDVLCKPILKWERQFNEKKEIEKLQETIDQTLGKGLIVRELVHKSLECKDQDPFVRQEEKSALLACQAFRFHQKYQTDQLNEVDEALRQAINTPYFSPILFKHERQVASVAFHPDAKVFVSASFDGTIRIWDLQTKTSKLVRLNEKSRESDGDGGGILSVAISPNGNTLAAGSGDHKVWLLDLNFLDTEPIPLTGHTDEVWSVAFSPDGKMLASGGWDTKVYLWDLTDPKNPLTICHHCHPDQVWSLAFSGNEHNGYTLATGCLNGTVWLWKLNLDQHIKQRLWKICVINKEGWNHKTGSEYPLRGNRCFSIALKANGESLYAGSQDGTIYFWDLSQLDEQTSKVEIVIPTNSIKQENSIRSVVAICDDRQWLASGDNRGVVSLWKRTNPDDNTGIIVAEKTELKGHREGISSVCFSKNSQWLVSGSWDGTVRLWDLSPPDTEPIILREHSQPITTVAFSPDSKKLASGSYDQTIRLWDIGPPNKSSCLLKDHAAGNINSIAFSSDGMLLAAGIPTGEIRIWKLDNPKEIFISLYEHRQEVAVVTFHPQDSQIFASGSYDCTIRLWNISDPDNPQNQILGRHEDRVTSVAFSPNGRFLASGSSDGTVMIWGLRHPDIPPIPLPNKLDGKISSIAFCRNEQSNECLLAIATEKRTVQFWDLSPLHKSLKARPFLRSEYSSLKGMYVAFSLDGGFFASDSQHGDVLLWDLRWPRAKPIHLEGHTRPVKALAFSSDGQWLAAGGEDTTVHLWIAKTDNIAKKVCQKVWRNLSREEWNDCVSEEIPYERTCEELLDGEGVPAGERLDILKDEFDNKLSTLYPEQKVLLEIVENAITTSKVNSLSEEEIKALIDEGNSDLEIEVPCEIETLCRLEFLTQGFESGVAIKKYGLSSRYSKYREP